MTPHEQIPWVPYPEMPDAERIAAARAFYEAIRTRRTCRFIGDKPVPRAAIEEAIRAAGTAPSGPITSLGILPLSLRPS